MKEKDIRRNNVPLNLRFLDLLRLFNDSLELDDYDVDSLSRQLANKRNYLSHYDDKLLENLQDINHYAEMHVDYNLENIALQLFMFVVYSQLNIPREVITKALKRSNTMFGEMLERIFDGPKTI